MASPPPPDTIERVLADEHATARAAAALARIARPGDVLALEGPLGAGKTAFARGFIAACVAADGVPAEEVPSPTFTLVQTYPFARFTVWHFDLFRLERAEDALELGLDEAFADGVSLVEWPARLGALLPARRLVVALAFAASPDVRRLTLVAADGWSARLAEAFGHDRA
ncbi:MAG: tRNA (adenosine(37)-N6)-threonylcarbamoyltransferase complex ATPase subunit type 1 TsaE [Alphaproteobacteria bacterium]|nr:tRNA (adenosine(37)-N6)-threonylcarbamoyltransferase complex ATPase subunit type 1 TsaE [Alphaproteobacteria bacterium]